MSSNGEVEFDDDSWFFAARWFENGPEDPEVVLIKDAAVHIDAWAGQEDRSFDVR